MLRGLNVSLEKLLVAVGTINEILNRGAKELIRTTNKSNKDRKSVV